MSEIFCLKWNDFQTSVSESYSKLRNESHFEDVIVVSDDEVQMSAHKVVLSASSSFFKKILIDNPHAIPLLYLGGISSTYLTLVLDYIYKGEVHIHQEHLDGFLDVAQRLRIKGLLTNRTNWKKLMPSENENGRDDRDEAAKNITDDFDEVAQNYEKKPRTNWKNQLPQESDRDVAAQDDICEVAQKKQMPQERKINKDDEYYEDDEDYENDEDDGCATDSPDV